MLNLLTYLGNDSQQIPKMAHLRGIKNTWARLHWITGVTYLSGDVLSKFLLNSTLLTCTHTHTHTTHNTYTHYTHCNLLVHTYAITCCTCMCTPYNTTCMHLHCTIHMYRLEQTHTYTHTLHTTHTATYVYVHTLQYAIHVCAHSTTLHVCTYMYTALYIHTD